MSGMSKWTFQLHIYYASKMYFGGIPQHSYYGCELPLSPCSVLWDTTKVYGKVVRTTQCNDSLLQLHYQWIQLTT